jgi:carboxyl-terminal processing protease
VGTLKLPVATYFRPNGKNVNRFPSSKDSDDWGVTPDPGYDVAVTDEELQHYEKDRATRGLVSTVETPTADFQDRQLLKAVEYLEAQLEHK